MILNESIYSMYQKWSSGNVRKEDVITKEQVLEFCKINKTPAFFEIKIENGKSVVDFKCDVVVQDESLINGCLPFQFGTIIGDFNCGSTNLVTLQNSPIEVTGHFTCSYSDIENFIGAPKIVGKNFTATGLSELTSLEGLKTKIGNILHVTTSSDNNNKENIIEDNLPVECTAKEKYINKSRRRPRGN